MLADDVLVHHGTDKSVAYLCEDPTKFTSHSDSSTAIPDGYVAMTDLPRKDGYILTSAMSMKGYTSQTILLEVQVTRGSVITSILV